MAIELLPYDHAAACKGAKLMTRDFRAVETFEYNPKLQEPVQVKAKIVGQFTPMTYFPNGRRTLEKENRYDLFIVAKPKKAKPVAAMRAKRK